MARKNQRTKERPSPDLIAKEIAELTRLKPIIRAHSAFGDNNRDAIQAEIDVLSDEALRDEDSIYDRYQPIDGEGQPDDSGNNRGPLDAALGALRWIEGEGDEPTLSASWAELEE